MVEFKQKGIIGYINKGKKQDYVELSNPKYKKEYRKWIYYGFVFIVLGIGLSWIWDKLMFIGLLSLLFWFKWVKLTEGFLFNHLELPIGKNHNFKKGDVVNIELKITKEEKE